MDKILIVKFVKEIILLIKYNLNNNNVDIKIDDKQYKKIEKMEVNSENDNNNIEENITIIKIHKKRKSNK